MKVKRSCMTGPFEASNIVTLRAGTVHAIFFIVSVNAGLLYGQSSHRRRVSGRPTVLAEVVLHNDDPVWRRGFQCTVTRGTPSSQRVDAISSCQVAAPRPVDNTKKNDLHILRDYPLSLSIPIVAVICIYLFSEYPVCVSLCVNIQFIISRI